MPHDTPGKPMLDLIAREGTGEAPSGPVPHPRLFFMMTAETPCPYLPGRWERKLVTEMNGPDAPELHTRLSRAGFRRSHHFAYRPACHACQACVPVRIPVDRFERSRSQRRIWRRNADLSVALRPARATAEQYELFRRYLLSRHAEGEMAAMSSADYRAMVEETALQSSLVEFRDQQNRLAAACLVDWLSDGGSAVYSFFTPELFPRSLGTHCILWLVEECRRRGLPYLYLGYWVAQSPKMAYKARFAALEGLTTKGWQPLSSPR